MSPARGAIRLARTAVFALSAVGLASAAHVAGGEPASAHVVMGAIPAVLLVVNLFVTGRRGSGSLFVAMSGVQVVLHAAFMAVSMADACHLDGQHTGFRHSARASCEPGVAGGHAHQASDLFMMPAPMLAAHALAVLLLALLLARGEAAVWALVEWLAFRLPRATRAVQLFPVGRLPVLAGAAWLPVAEVLRNDIRRRGPPRAFS